MKHSIWAAIAAGLALAMLTALPADAKGSKGSGAKSQSTTVRGYTTKSGKHVAKHHRTTPDRSKRNNYSSKGNVNPYTGKAGKK